LHVGEIALRGIGLMAGYWCGDAGSKDRGRRWFRTGDLARVDEHGKFSLVGRADDLLKIGGRKVVPQEVESALNRHSAVLQSAVVGKIDEERIMEQKLHAYVVLQNGVKVTDEELLFHCRSLLESYKVPSKVHFCSSLPVSSLGKLQRHLL
jgi:acyl-coenzyme A synthetase/AMP-(fatty) acid ligase